jgi:hypothetical protein
VDNNGTLWVLLAGVALALSIIVAFVLRRRGGTAASLRPPAATPALDKIEMIRRYSEQYGVSLAEAKEAIEAQAEADRAARDG